MIEGHILLKMRKYTFAFLLLFISLKLLGEVSLDSLIKKTKTLPEDSLAKAYNDISLKLINDNPDSAIYYAHLAIEYAEKFDNKKEMMYGYDGLGASYSKKGIYDKSLYYYNNSLEIAIELQDKKNIAYEYNNIGVVYKTQGKYQKAIEYYQKSYEIHEQMGNNLYAGWALGNIANIYWNFGIDYQKALDANLKALELIRKANRPTYEALILNNIGLVYKSLNNPTKAIEYLTQSLEISERIKNLFGVAQAQSSLIEIYLEAGDYSLALKYSKSNYKTFIQLGDDANAARSLRDAARTYQKMGNYAVALDHFNQSLALDKKMNLKKDQLDNYKDIANLYYTLGDYKKAFLNFQSYSSLRDSIMGEDYLKQIQEMEAKYESDKKDKEIQLQKETNKRQRFVIYFFIFFAVVVLTFLVLLYKLFTDKKKANVLLAEQNDEIKKQRDQIFQQKKEITDSIHYASRIQRAVLPSPKILEDYNLQYFILYKPRDIVSGDFYWINQKDNKVLIAAADCTGHGVPGAFMSMLGMALLNEIVTKGEFTNAAHVLDQLRHLVVKSLHQSGKTEETKDGMDISLCMIDKDSSTVQFAGAFNPMYMVRNNELLEANADRMPVGFHDKLGIPFTNSEMKLEKGDTLYIFSDGYVDQFGGENGKKFMAKKFKQLLVSINGDAMEQQREILDQTITDWRGELDQVDDIMVIGVKF